MYRLCLLLLLVRLLFKVVLVGFLQRIQLGYKLHITYDKQYFILSLFEDNLNKQ